MKFTKGESLIAYAQLMLESRLNFKADLIQVELIKAKVLSDIEDLQKAFGAEEDLDIKALILVFLMTKLCNTFVRDNPEMNELFNKFYTFREDK